jgi:hypothetical protein
MLFEYNYPSLDQHLFQMVFRISLVNALISYLILYNKSTFPGYFTCGLVYNGHGHLAGTG